MIEQLANHIVDYDPAAVLRRTRDTVRCIESEWNKRHAEPIDEGQLRLFLCDEQHGDLTEEQEKGEALLARLSAPQMPAHLPAGRRFGGQPPATRAALRSEMCGHFQGFPTGVVGTLLRGVRNLFDAPNRKKSVFARGCTDAPPEPFRNFDRFWSHQA